MSLESALGGTKDNKFENGKQIWWCGVKKK